MSDEWADFTGVEEMHQRIGTGDHATVHFSCNVRGPIIPGSLVIRVLPEDAVSQLAALEDETRFEARCDDSAETGVLKGDVEDGSIVNYWTGQIMVVLRTAPRVGEPVWAAWKRRLHRLHDAKVQVRLPPHGKIEWVSLGDLSQAQANF